MRSLWAQVGRIGCSCRCYNCLEQKHVLVRRMSTAIARVRSGQAVPRFYQELARPLSQKWRRQQVRHNSDETVKKAWGKQREHAAKAAEELDKISEKINRKDQSEAINEEKRREGLTAIASELQSLKIGHWSVDDVMKYEPRPGGLRPPKVPTTSTANPQFIPPQSPWARDDLKRRAYASVWTKKKIAKMETSIALFVFKICMLTDLNTQWPSNLIVLPEAIRPFARLTPSQQLDFESQLQSRLDVLRNRHGIVEPHDPPQAPEELRPFIPSYEHYEDGSHHELIRDLNASLVELIEGHRKQQLTFMALLVKICHNLLVSSCPPNMQTMNILLLAFNTLGRRDENLHARYVLMDLLVEICRAVKIRPNEITCATILSCYRKRGMKQSFSAFILAMRGAGFESLMYTGPLNLTRDNAARLIATHDHDKLYKQAVYPSAMVFSEIIKGVLRFCSINDAVDICDEFAAKEWGFDWSCLDELLHACMVERNFEGGVRVWARVIAFRAVTMKVPNQIYSGMLALCLLCKKQDMFDEVLTFAMNHKARLRIDADELQLRAGKIAAAKVRQQEEVTDYEHDHPKKERDAYLIDLKKEYSRDPRFRRNMFFGQARDEAEASGPVDGELGTLELAVGENGLDTGSNAGMAAFEWEGESKDAEEASTTGGEWRVGAETQTEKLRPEEEEGSGEWSDSLMSIQGEVGVGEDLAKSVQSSPAFKPFRFVKLK